MVQTRLFASSNLDEQCIVDSRPNTPIQTHRFTGVSVVGREKKQESRNVSNAKAVACVLIVQKHQGMTISVFVNLRN